jgi:hypothetical protein
MQSLPRRLSRCILGQEPFEQGMEYLSFLDLEGCRRDYCPACWEKIEKKGEGHFWKGKIPYKQKKASQPDENALELFRQHKDPKQRFVLALYLQRRGQLMRRTQTLYEIPETGELFEVEKISLSLEEGERVAKEIHCLIEGAVVCESTPR